MKSSVRVCFDLTPKEKREKKMENAALHELNVHSYPNNIAKATLELAGEISKDDALQKQSPTSHYEKWV